MAADAQRLFSKRPRDGKRPTRSRLRAGLAAATIAALGLPASALGLATPTTFSSTGAEQSYTVPSGVLLEGVLAQGAWGGSTDPQPPASQGIFAAGATLQGYLSTTPGQTLFAEVGQNGTAGGGPTFGGGGAAGGAPPGVPDCTLSGSDMSVPCSGPWAGSGGGASDVRTCSELAASCPGGGSSAASRVIVAAGGGGEGGGGLNGNGAGCGGGTEYDLGGIGQNNQLPTASSAGPAAITTAAGIAIPGFAGGDLASVTTTDGYTNAAMGTTAAGAAGTGTECSVGTSPNTVTYSGSVSGSSGSGPSGGAGGSASALSPCCGSLSFAPGGGGGGGGGYFGGGGGATGMGSCSGMSCNGNGGAGEGGGAGSSFVSDAIEYPTFTFAQSPGDVYIEFWPIIEIDTPANGATYSPGQVVDAQWECDGYAQGPGGCDSSSGTVPSGSPIDTTPGTHTFTVNAKVNETGNGSQPVSATVTYTVTDPPTASITTPTNNASYTYGSVPNSAFTCADGAGGPGINTCTGSVDGGPAFTSGTPLPGSAGSHTLTVTATSGDGQTATATAAYTVNPAPTLLTAAPQLVIFPPPTGVGLGKVSATLTTGGSPLTGQTIEFTADKHQLCTAQTGANGTATCSVGFVDELEILFNDNQYTATYTATTDYLGSTANAPAIELGSLRGSAASRRASGSALAGTLRHGDRVYATLAGRTGSATLVLKPSRQLRNVRYTLTIQINARRHRTTLARRTVTL